MSDDFTLAVRLKDSVLSVTKNWAKQRKAEERHASAAANRRARLISSYRETIKDVAFEVMEKAYLAASTNDTLPATARQVMYAARPEIQERTDRKLDDQVLLALKQSRGQPPFDKPTSLQPNIPCKDGASVLVDVDAAVSADLVTHITLIGGKLAISPDPAHIIRAMIPLSQLEALSWRAEVKSISTARPTVTSVIKP